jgi:hypothetical protein
MTRISSARPHKKYRKNFVHTIDAQNKLVRLFGTDGRSLNFEDTIVLNYRKKSVWDLFLDEMLQFVEQYGVTGLHLDNAQSWPQIFMLD